MAYQFIDTHCHVHELLAAVTPVHAKWLSDGVKRTPETVLGDARAVGVTRLIVIGTTLEDSELAAQFAQEHENVWAAIGIHPHEAKNYTKTQNTASRGSTSRLTEECRHRFTALVRRPKVVAVGECGLDYFYGHSPREDQEILLRFQIELALEQGLPLSFHVREAFDDFWRILADYPAVRGVLHSFSDSQANMEAAIARGLYIGVNGIATFTKDESQRVTYRTIPQHSLLLETDAPFLTPVPFRGKVCEPKHVVQTAEFLAELRGEGVANIAAHSTENATRLFNLT